MASLLRGFATINRAADGQPDGEQPGLTTEAKEQRAIASFERALALIQGHREEEAEAALRALLEEPVVAEGATDQLHRIKFLALKNLGDLLARRPGSVGDALAWYSLATQIVEDDALLWNKLGTLAAESGYVAAARTAFERGLELDPQHPTMPDKLLSLLSQAGDAPAAATLATALLRQNPRHAGAAAVLTAQQRGGSGILAAATGAALLQLPPAEMRPGGEVRPSHRQHLERPRTLEQPTWQQLLHHSLLFMTGNRLVEGAAPAAAGGGPLPERKAVPSLVRFNYKKKPPAGQQQAQVQAQQQGSQQQGVGPEASPAATAVQESLTPAGAPALAEHGQQQEQQQQQQGLATPAPSVSPSPAPAAAQGEDASPAAMAVDQSPAAPAALEATTPAAPSPLSPSATPVGTDVASSPGTAQVQCSPAASPAASPADEEQEQRHPNGRGSSKAEARATRSRAATGKAPLPLVPAAADGDQEQTPDEEALELLCTLGSRLSKPQQAAEQGGAPSPLLSSPAKAGRGAAAASSNDQQAAAAQQEEEEAVKAFIKQLPAQGISRPELAALLLNTLGSASGAAQLSAAAHLQLLQVAHHVEHDELALSAEHCLVLGELFADAAVAATRAPAQPGSTAPAAAVASSSAAPQASRGSTPTAPGMHQSSGLVKRSASTRGRRSDLTLEQLQQSCRLWLSRYRLAVAEVAVSPGEELLRGQARYWWATGRLLESAGDMPAASGAYARCESSLDQLGSIAMLQAVERAQDVAWHLCEALGTVQALMERRGRFVQACMRELQSLLKRLDALGPVPASAFDDDTPDAAELRQQLTGGVQHCLFWLFGLELPGLDKQEEWGGDFHAKGGAEAAARQLTSPQAVADVWPLVEPHLLQDVEHVAKHRAFLQAAAEHFSGLPVEAAARSAAAWRQLAAAEPPHMPCDELDGTYPDAMQRLLELASQAPPFQPSEGQEAGAGAAAADAMAVEGQAEAQAGQEGDEQVPFVAVRRSLYYLLSELQDKERTSVDNLLGEDAEAAVERHVQAAKADLCFNPQRSATWEKLAHEYHGAADDLLDAASKAITHRQWRHDRDFRRRVRLWRRLAYWATAGAWLTATSDDDRTRLLAASGWRLLQDVLRTLPCQDPLASNAAWQEVKSSSAYQEGCRLAEAAFDAAAAALEQQDDMAGWELLVAKARCLRKQQQPPVNWLPLLARACHYASSDDGGVLYPLYTLHASRMRMLLAMPSAARWAGNGASVAVQAKRSGRWREREQQSREQERDLLQLVGSYCFLPASNTSLNSPSQPARRPAAAAAEEELKEDWQGLLEDCCAAMRWCLEKDRNFHRAAYRLADAMQRTGQSHRAVALLEPLFTRGKQVFTANITPILESKVDAAPKRGRKARQLGGGAQEQEQQQADGGEGAAPEPEPECNWGEPPARLTSIGVQEDEATFGTRLRKTLRLYFSCLADAAAAAVDGQALPESQAGRQPPLEVLQQAAAYIFSMPPSASKAWDGCDKLARGHFLLALVACLRTCCPLEQLPGLGPPAPTPRLVPAPDEGASTAVGMEVDASEAQHAQQGQQTPGAALIAAHAAHAAGPLSAAPASAVQATPAEAVGTARSLWPTPATHARHQQSQRLLQVAAGLNGSPAELLLAKAHQVFSDYSMHAEGDDKWKSVAAPAVQEALSNSSSSVVADEEVRQLGSQPEHLRKFFNLYAMLHVHLLQHEGATDKLLTLLLAMKKRVKGISTAEPRHARFLRRQALVLSEALLGAVEGALAKAERDVGAGAALPEQAAPQEPDAPMEVDEQPAEGAVGQAQQEQQEQQRALQGQSPAPASGATEPHGSQLPASPAEQQQQLATQTPAGATAGAAARGITPGTNLRAVLGTPATLPSVEQQQLQERCVALLQVAHSFQRDLSRWLQMMGAAASGSTAAAREEMRALGSISEDVLLRAYRLHVRCTGQPTMAELSRQSRAEQLKAAEEAAKQQRRQSRQQGAAGRQQQQQGGASAAAAGALPPIAEAGEEQPAPPAGRKRGANEAAPPTTRKRLRSASVAPQPQPQQAQEEEAAAAAVHEVAQAVEAAAAAEQAAE
ncbi:hypothetical protein ABPG75_001207 [Micractinium tetrahymenae]